MMDYFNKSSAHLQGDMDIDAIFAEGLQTRIISIGSDDLIKWKNLQTNESDQIQLQGEHGFNKIALHPSGTKFLVGGQSKTVCEYSIYSKKLQRQVYESPGQILDIKYSPTGRYISVATDEQKVIVIDSQSNRRTKCRPGHNNCRVLNTFFSSKDRYVASIGQDCFVLLYQLASDEDPKQVFRTKFTNQTLPLGLKGSFCQMNDGYRVFVPGTTSLQIIQQLSSRWQIKKTMIAHSSPIIACQSVMQKYLVTSCKKDLIIWSIAKQQKLISLEEISMCKIIGTKNSFLGINNDGNIYTYNRTLPSIDQMEERPHIQGQQNQSQINFNADDQNIELEYQQKQQGQESQEFNQRVSKKSKADKIIKVFPQQQIFRRTDFSQDQRFLYISMYGYIIETRENQQFSISVQFNGRNQKHPQVKNLFKNKRLTYFAMNESIVCYANQNQYGVKIDSFTYWEKQWYDIQGIALGANWVAVANQSQIRILDLLGNLIKSICFDRIIIAMEAYENLLAIVYHQGIPIYESQLLSMRIFNVNQSSAITLPQCHVPITILEGKDNKTQLLWFGFSRQGMIFSKDTVGGIRSYSLETNQWTLLGIQSSIDQKKAWVVGFENYNMHFWRITDSQPEPTVRPRLLVKQTKLMINTLNQYTDQLQIFPNLLWQRYCIDHQMARWRLWGHHKFSRDKKNSNYQLSTSIMNEKQIHESHLKLDSQFYPIIKYYIKNKQTQRALYLIKSHVRLIQAAKNMVEFLDECGHRSQSIQLQYYIQEKQRQVQYEVMQQAAMKELKSKLQVNIKLKKQNPMNPKNKAVNKSSLLFNISSQPSSHSQNSSIMEDITHKSQQSSRIQEVIQNPFLKKRSEGDKKQQIEDHIQKYGVKRKVQQKKKK